MNCLKNNCDIETKEDEFFVVSCPYYLDSAMLYCIADEKEREQFCKGQVGIFAKMWCESQLFWDRTERKAYMPTRINVEYGGRQFDSITGCGRESWLLSIWAIPALTIPPIGELDYICSGVEKDKILYDIRTFEEQMSDELVQERVL